MPEIKRLTKLPLPVRIRFTVAETKEIADGASALAVVAGAAPELAISKAVATGLGLMGVMFKYGAKLGYAIEVYYVAGLLHAWRLCRPKPGGAG